MKTRVFLLFVLFLCSCGSHEQSIKTLSPEGTSTEVQEEKDPVIAMSKAIASGNLLKMNQLLEDGLNIDSLTEGGLNFLMVAIGAKQFAALELLVDKGASTSITTESEDFNPPVDAFGYIDSQSLMTEQDKQILLAILNNEPFDVSVLAKDMFTAIQDRNYALVHWMLKKGVDPNYFNEDIRSTPLIFVFNTGTKDEQVVAETRKVFDVILAADGIDINQEADGFTALCWAKIQAMDFPDQYNQFVTTLTDMGGVSGDGCFL